MKAKFTSLLQKIGASVASLAAFLVAASPAQAQTDEIRVWTDVCVGSTENAQDVATIQGLECLIANVFTVIIAIIGLSGFVMFVIAGITWMVSGGDTNKVSNARNSMTYAVVGMVVALSAFIVLNLIASFTGISIITQFRIPISDTGL